MVDSPFTVKVMFPRIARKSNTEGEGVRQIPKCILSIWVVDWFVESTSFLFCHKSLMTPYSKMAAASDDL